MFTSRLDFVKQSAHLHFKLLHDPRNFAKFGQIFIKLSIQWQKLLKVQKQKILASQHVAPKKKFASYLIPNFPPAKVVNTAPAASSWPRRPSSSAPPDAESRIAAPTRAGRRSKRIIDASRHAAETSCVNISARRANFPENLQPKWLK